MGFDYRRLALTPRQIRRGAHKEQLGGGAAHWQRRGEFQLALLRHLGLVAGSRLLDVGCGPLRGGLPLLRFLTPGHYRGVDSNPSLIEAAHHELQSNGLVAAATRVTLLQDFAFATLAERFDFVLCFSVLNHCSDDERAAFFAALPAVLAPSTRVVITHAHWLENEGANVHGFACERRLVAEHDLPAELAPTRWSFPAGEGGPLPIVVLTPAAGAGGSMPQ